MQPTAVITHPNKPDVSVTVKKLRRTERYRIADKKRTSAMHAVVVYDKDGNPAINARTGEVQAFLAETLPPIDVLNDELAEWVVDWRNVPNESGALIPFSRDAVRSGVLFDEHLDVEIVDPNDARSAPVIAGEREARKLSGSFGQYIQMKLTDPTTFDKDPSGNS